MIFYAICFLVSNYCYAQEIDQPLNNNEAVQSALDHAEEIRAQRNNEQKESKQLNKEGLDLLVDKIIQGVEPPKEKLIIDKIQIDNMPIRKAVQVVADKAGMKSEVEQGISGEVSLFLNNVELADVLAIICEMDSLAYSIEGQKIAIMTLETYQAKNGHPFKPELIVKVIPLKNVDYADVLVALEEKRSPRGEILYDEKSNSLIVKDDIDSLAEIEAYLQKVDVAVETVIFNIEASQIPETVKKIKELLTEDIGIVSVEEKENRVIVTDLSKNLELIKKVVEKKDKNLKISYALKALQIILFDEHEDGIDWDAIVSDYQRIKYFNGDNPKQQEENRYLSLGTVSAEDYLILLEALDTVGEIHVLSEVQEITDSHEMTLGADFKEVPLQPASNIKEIEEKSETMKIALSFLEKEDSTLSLTLLPVISSGKFNQKDALEGITAEGFPLKIENGATIVIGSLLKDVLVESTRKIPLLGDLPLLGFAFRNQGRKIGKSEVIFFITIEVVEE